MTVTLRQPVTPPTTANGLLRQVNSSRTTPRGGFRDKFGNKQIVHVASAWSGSAGNAYLCTSLNGTTWVNVTAFAMTGDGEFIQSAFQDSLGKVHVISYSFSAGPMYRRLALSYTSNAISSCTVEAFFEFTIDDGTYTADNRPDLCELRDGLGNIYIGFLNSCSRQSDTGWRINLARFPRDITSTSQITGINGTGTRTELYTSTTVAGHERMACIVQFDDRAIGVFGGYVIGEFPATTDYIAKAILPVATDTTWTLNAFTNETTNDRNHGNVIVRGNNAYRCTMTGDTYMHIDRITSGGTLTADVFPTVQLDPGSDSAVLNIAMSDDATKVYAACVSYADNSVLAHYNGSSWTRDKRTCVNWGGNAVTCKSGISMLAVNDNTTIHIITAWDDAEPVETTVLEVPAAPTESFTALQQLVTISETPTVPSESFAAEQATRVNSYEAPDSPSELADVLQATNVAVTESPANPSESASALQATLVDVAESPASPNEATTVEQWSYVATSESPDAPTESAVVTQGTYVYVNESPASPSESTTIEQRSYVVTSEAPSSPSESASIVQRNYLDVNESPVAPTEAGSVEQWSYVGTSESPDAPTEAAVVTQGVGVFTIESPAAPSESTTIVQPNVVIVIDSTTNPSEAFTVEQPNLVIVAESPVNPTESVSLTQPANVVIAEAPGVPSESLTVEQRNTVATAEAPDAPTEAGSVLQPSTSTVTEAPSEPSESTAVKQPNLVITSESTTSPSETIVASQGTYVLTSEAPDAPSETIDVDVSTDVAVSAVESPASPGESFIALQVNMVQCAESPRVPRETAFVNAGLSVIGGSIRLNIRSFGSIKLNLR